MPAGLSIFAEQKVVLEETPSHLSLILGAGSEVKPIRIDKASIETRKKLKASLMPKGLASKLSREQILDLLAYLVAGGDKEHAIYRGANP